MSFGSGFRYTWYFWMNIEVIESEGQKGFPGLSSSPVSLNKYKTCSSDLYVGQHNPEHNSPFVTLFVLSVLLSSVAALQGNEKIQHPRPGH